MRPIVTKACVSFFILAMLLPLFACGSPSGKNVEKKLLGKWVDKSEATVEYFDDGTFLLRNPPDPEELSGKWVILQDGRLKMDFTSMEETKTIVRNLKFDGNELISTGKDGKSSRFKKLK